MKRSLNEVETLVRKAAIGAGLETECATEIAQATCWLEQQKLSGIEAASWAISKFVVPSNELTAIDNRYELECILSQGSSLTDMVLVEDRALSVDCAEQCDLLIGLAGVAAQNFDVEFKFVAFSGSKLKVSAYSIEGDLSGFQQQFELSKSPLDAALAQEQYFEKIDIVPNPKHWNLLNEFASKTYVPESEQSRLLGAGAGLSDND